MPTDYHEQLFSRADRYYRAAEAGLASRRRPKRWPAIAGAFVSGAAVALTAVSFASPQPAAALPAKIAALAAHAAAPSPGRLAADAAAYRQQAARSAMVLAYRQHQRQLAARRHLLAVLAAEYRDPLRDVSGLVPERVDMGVDFGGYGPVYALGPGIIQATYNIGWPGGGWICELLTAGRYAGASVYVAEDVSASVGIGQQVTSLTIIGTMQGGIETGWAQAGCAGNALAGYYPGIPTAAGIAYNAVLVSQGAPSGTGVAGAGPLGSRPACGWRCYPRNEAMDWAVRQAGCWYAWEGTSCGQGFDCSGLVMMAYRAAGFSLPRTTYEILGIVGVRHYRRHSWWALVQVRNPERGDLAFYGSGHVELATKRYHETFGAHDSGTQVSYARWGYGWVPTAFYRIEVHRR